MHSLPSYWSENPMMLVVKCLKWNIFSNNRNKNVVKKLKIWLPLELRGIMCLFINLVMRRHQNNFNKGETKTQSKIIKRVKIYKLE